MEPEHPERQYDNGHSLAGARILIVEDQPVVTALLEEAIGDAGGNVVAVATTVQSAIAVISSDTISAAVVTMIVGGVYADEIVRELLRRKIPYAVTTGIGTDLSHPELHASRTIVKPFQTAYVQKVLADMITASGSRAADAAAPTD